MPTRSRLAVLLLAVFVSACGGDAVVSPASAVRVDLGQVFRELSGSGIQGALAAGGGAIIPSTLPGPAVCGYSTATMMFVCPTVTTTGHTVTLSYSLMNAAGATLSQFDATAVAAVRVRETLSGTDTTADGPITLDGQQDLTLSGLLTSTHLLNGTTTLNVTGTAKAFVQSGAFALRSTMSMVNVVLPASATTSSYPASGTVTMDLVSAFAGAPSITSQTVMKFNGTSKVTMTFTVNGLTLRTCTMDLAASTPSCV